jgi:hypothetical protein
LRNLEFGLSGLNVGQAFPFRNSRVLHFTSSTPPPKHRASQLANDGPTSLHNRRKATMTDRRWNRRASDGSNEGFEPMSRTIHRQRQRPMTGTNKHYVEEFRSREPMTTTTSGRKTSDPWSKASMASQRRHWRRWREAQRTVERSLATTATQQANLSRPQRTI